MVDRRIIWGMVFFLVLLVGGVYVVQSPLLYQVTGANPDGYDRVNVTAYSENGTELATVRVRVADTQEKRYLGLSNTSELAMGEGMLFVHESVGTHGYVMRDMAFPLDIVFIDADERVTTIHHAGVPEGSYEQTYSGRGKWVLEVPRGWANRTGVDEDDRIAIPAAARNASG